MDEQFQNQPASPAPKSGMGKMIVMNVIITVLISLIVSLGVFYFLAEKRIAAIEKQTSAFSGKIKIGK